MSLLIIINGKKENFLNHLKVSDNEALIKKIDDKVLSEFKYLKNFIRKSGKNEVWFGTIQNDLQRFQFFILYYIFATTKMGGLIDESGKKIKYSLSKLLFKYLPKFLIEGFASLLILIYFNLKITFDKWRLKN